MHSMYSIVYFLAIAVLVANVGDIVTTIVGLSLGHVETNPLSTKLGIEKMLLFKIAVVTTVIIVGVAACCYTSNTLVNLSAAIVFAVMAAIFAVCIINNIGVILLE